MSQEPEKNRATTFLLWGIGIATILAVVFSVRYLTRERVTVLTAQASFQPIVKTSSTNGKVEPVEDFPAYAQAPGVVKSIEVSVGDKVKQGQLLLSMDDADAKARLASAQSALQAARLALSDIQHGGTQDERNTYAADLDRQRMQLQQDQASLAALQRLQQTGAASAAEIASVNDRIALDQTNLRSTQQHSTQRYGDADLAGAQARLADAQAAVAAAQSAVAADNIRAPFNGTVYSIPVSEHDYVAAGADLIYVADLNRVQVTAYFDEPEVGNLAVGQPVTIVWDARRGTVWHGHITIAPTSIISYGGTRNVGECFITVDDAHGDLQPNANVTVTVTTAQKPRVLTVPREALHTDGMKNFVFRVIGKRLVRTPVQVGVVNNTKVEITSGLTEGDTVATTATAVNIDLTNGLEITAK
jgi:HlyD family secretion protein